MKIETHKVVTIDYTLKDDDGNLLDSSSGRDPLPYLHGADNIIPGLEKALVGKKKGDAVSVSVTPEEGYGQHDAAKVQSVPRSVFDNIPNVAVGERYAAAGPNGEQVGITVVGIEQEHIVVDANHPLAGKTLNFDVTVVDVRDATEDEVAHGHVHTPDTHAG